MGDQRTRPCGGCSECAGRIVAPMEDLACTSPIPIDEHGRDITLEGQLRAEIAVRDQDAETLRSENEDLRKRADQAEAAVARVRALHKQVTYAGGTPHCYECCDDVIYPWPCDTIRALDGQE